MEWIADPAAGAWLRERVEDDFSTMHVVVPRGFPAYARVFHPGVVRQADAGAHVTWTDTAAAFGTTLHPLAQWQRIVRTPMDGDWHERISPDGREFSAPEEGRLSPHLVSAVARHLVAHTSTPDAGIAAIWEGWGGVLGHLGYPSKSTFGDDVDATHQAMLMRSTHDPFNNAFRKRTWQEGRLSREISEGQRLALPHRAHVLFSGSARDFIDERWAERVPWADPSTGSGTPGMWTQSPSILWPEDRAWVMVTEVDYDSTIVAGSPALIAALVADDRVEALQISEGADLSWDADEVNR